MCEEFLEELSLQLDTKIFGTIDRFEKLFEYILELGTTHSFTLIIDEFQEFGKINPSIYSSIQKLWDLYKYKTHIHFIACGSIYKPTFGRADFKIDMKHLILRVCAILFAMKIRFFYKRVKIG